MPKLTEEEKYVMNLRYTLRMLKDNNYSREEIIQEFEQELRRYENGSQSRVCGKMTCQGQLKQEVRCKHLWQASFCIYKWVRKYGKYGTMRFDIEAM